MSIPSDAPLVFWERVFLSRVVHYRNQGWDASSSACAAKDADEALAEWAKRWDGSVAITKAEVRS
jgi:hypothetical protein